MTTENKPDDALPPTVRELRALIESNSAWAKEQLAAYAKESAELKAKIQKLEEASSKKEETPEAPAKAGWFRFPKLF